MNRIHDPGFNDIYSLLRFRSGRVVLPWLSGSRPAFRVDRGVRGIREVLQIREMKIQSLKPRVFRIRIGAGRRAAFVPEVLILSDRRSPGAVPAHRCPGSAEGRFCRARLACR